MKDLLAIDTANDYARDIGAPIYHPHVCIVHYDESGRIRHTLNRFNVYGIFVQKNFPPALVYGMGRYHTDTGSLVAYAPGQIGGQEDDGDRTQYFGWALLIDQDFMHGTEFERNIDDYHFFSYNVNEALRLLPDEEKIIDGLMSTIRDELRNSGDDRQADKVVQDYILLIADYCNRFYARQFKSNVTANSDVLTRFQKMLADYYSQGRQYKYGVPTVKYCAGELFMSPGYFGDVIRNAVGQNPTEYIRNFVMERAKELLVSGKNVTETALELGFDYPQHFTRVFKKETGMQPSKFVESRK